MIKITCKTKAKLLAHFDGLKTKLLLTTFYVFLEMSVDKRKNSFFLKSKNRKIRHLEHCLYNCTMADHSLSLPSHLQQFNMVLYPASH